MGITIAELRSKVFSWGKPTYHENAIQGQLDRHAGQIQATQEAVNRLCEQVSLLTHQASRAPSQVSPRRGGVKCYN